MASGQYFGSLSLIYLWIFSLKFCMLRDESVFWRLKNKLLGKFFFFDRGQKFCLFENHEEAWKLEIYCSRVNVFSNNYLDVLREHPRTSIHDRELSANSRTLLPWYRLKVWQPCPALPQCPERRGPGPGGESRVDPLPRRQEPIRNFFESYHLL